MPTNNGGKTPSLTVVANPAPVRPVVTPSTVPGAGLKRMKLKELPRLSSTTPYINAAYYGRDGSRKTSHMLGMAKLGDVLAIDLEAGAKVSSLIQLGIPVENIIPWPGDGREEDFTIENLEAIYYTILADLRDDPLSWAGITIDTLTECVGLLVANARVKAVAAGKGKTSLWSTDRDDYGEATNQVLKLLRWFRSLPCHFAFTAQERRDSDPDGKVAYSPAVNPALMTQIPAMVDILCHTEIIETGDDLLGVGWTQYHGLYRAKDQFRVLPRRMPDPTFDRMYAYVTGEMTKATDPILSELRERASKATTGGKGSPQTS